MGDFKEGLSWQIGKGKFSFWFTSWLFNKHLAQLIDIPLQFINLQVEDCINFDTFQWKYNILNQLVPDWILQHIHSITIPITKVEDIPFWNPNSSGKFSVRSTYDWLITKDKNGIFPQIPWKKIWMLYCPPKVKICIW